MTQLVLEIVVTLFTVERALLYLSVSVVLTVPVTQSPSVPGPSKTIKKQKAPVPEISNKSTMAKSYHRTDELISLQLETYR